MVMVREGSELIRALQVCYGTHLNRTIGMVALSAWPTLVYKGVMEGEKW